MRARAVWVTWAALTMTSPQASEGLFDFSLVLPPTPDKHLVIRPAVSWEVRPDASNYCAQVQDQEGHAVWREGCVIWNRSKSTCTIVTTASTTHSVMGRLFLLCLQAGEWS